MCIRDSSTGDLTNEQSILIQAIQDSNYPKFILEDAKLFHQILDDIFPGALHVDTESVLLEVINLFINFLSLFILRIIAV